MYKLPITLMLGLFLLAGAFPAEAQSKRKQARLLEVTQSAYANAIRWGEFEEAWQLVDPGYREANPMTELAMERYQQVQVSGYADRSSQGADDGSVVRNVDLRVINRHTMSERSLRYQETWRWDAETRRWWLHGGLPDFWDGE